MASVLPIFVSETAFHSGIVYEPITSVVEDCIDVYRQSGVTEDMMDEQIAGLLFLDWYCGRVSGSGHKFYLGENGTHSTKYLALAKTGADLLGWQHGVELIQSVIDWSDQNSQELSTLVETDSHDQVLREFDKSVLRNNLSRAEAEELIATLPREIAAKLLSEHDKNSNVARSEYYVRAFIYLWTDGDVRKLPDEQISEAVKIALETSYPGLASKTRAQRQAAFEARRANDDLNAAIAHNKPWWKFW